MVSPTVSAAKESRPLNSAISVASAPYFLASELSVSPAATTRWMPETGKMMSVSPGWTFLALPRLFAQTMVFTETLKSFAICESVSPGRTT